MRDQDLEVFFAQARAEMLPDTAQLQARVLGDATQHLPQILRPAPSIPYPRGFWDNISKALGGRGVLAGLVGATVTGVLVGYVQPAPFAMVAETIFASSPPEELELLPNLEANLIEG